MTPLPWGNRGHYRRETANNLPKGKQKEELYNKALQDYNQAVTLASKDGKVFNSRGKTLFDMGRTQEALKDYDKAIELMPEKGEFYINRGAAYGTLNQLNEALEQLSRGLELEPDFANGYLNRSLLYYKTRQFKLAKQDHDAYLALKPNNAGIWYERAITNRQLGDENAALADLTQAIRLEQNPVFYMERAKVYNQLGNYQQAVQDGQKAKESGYGSYC